MVKNWIYRLDKLALIEILRTHKQASHGTVAQLRKRLSAYASRYPHPFDAAGRTPVMLDQPAEKCRKEVPEVSQEMTQSQQAGPSDASKTPRAAVSCAVIPVAPGHIDQIRKWGVHFDGREPLSFLERVSELRDAYDFTGAQLLKGLPELIRGEPLLWYRNSRNEWTTWQQFEDDFRKQFVPRQYAATSMRAIRDRLQRPGESFNSYATDMLTMMRRARDVTEEEQVERMIENMNPDYRLYMQRSAIESVADLKEVAAEYEEVQLLRADYADRKSVV